MMMTSAEKPNVESLLAEYASANDAYMHYDNFSWQVGAVLIAGAFVFWGFLIDKNIEPVPFFVGSMLVAALMSLWMMYSSHNRQIYLCKLHRLHEIERILGLKQHLRWAESEVGNQPAYRTFGPSGHTLDALIYVCASLGAPLIGIFKNSDLPLCLGLLALLCFFLMVVAVIGWIRHNEHDLKNHLKRIAKEDSDPSGTQAKGRR